MNYNNAEFITSFGNLKQFPSSEKQEVAFSGRSNVGKSSLINKLLNRKKLARVSSMPGKTVTVNFYSVDTIVFADLPGYGYANVSKGEKKKWDELVGGYLSDNSRQLSLVVQLVDMRHAPSKDDLNMINYFIDGEIPFVIAFTKADKLSKNERIKRMAGFAEEIPCFDSIRYAVCSAMSGEGMDDLKALIEEATEQSDEE